MLYMIIETALTPISSISCIIVSKRLNSLCDETNIPYDASKEWKPQKNDQTHIRRQRSYAQFIFLLNINRWRECTALVFMELVIDLYWKNTYMIINDLKSIIKIDQLQYIKNHTTQHNYIEEGCCNKKSNNARTRLNAKKRHSQANFNIIRIYNPSTENNATTQTTTF